MLETKRLQIRPFARSDAAEVYAYCSREAVGVGAGWRPHASLAQSAAILDDWIAEDCKQAIVLRESGAVIGHIAIDPDSEEDRADTRELGFALHPAYHARGIMSEAVSAVLSYLFRSQQVQYVWACCFQGNAASKRLIEKCGFRLMQGGTFYSDSLKRNFPPTSIA